MSTSLAGNPPRFLQRCVECGSDRSLSILGSRAASLLSVAISRLYSTEYNKDRKLLAFTDSVQDAAHRAGFFGGRTYRFNMRTAIQGALEHFGGKVAVKDLPERMLEFWGSRMEEPKLVATMWPADLREYPEFVRFQESGQSSVELKEILEKRLEHIKTPMSLSIIGCVVNGPGEALMTDVGYTGGGAGSGMVYLAGRQSHKLGNDAMIDHIVEQVEKKAAELEAAEIKPAAE